MKNRFPLIGIVYDVLYSQIFKNQGIVSKSRNLSLSQTMYSTNWGPPQDLLKALSCFVFSNIPIEHARIEKIGESCGFEFAFHFVWVKWFLLFSLLWMFDGLWRHHVFSFSSPTSLSLSLPLLLSLSLLPFLSPFSLSLSLSSLSLLYRSWETWPAVCQLPPVQNRDYLWCKFYNSITFIVCTWGN